MGSGAGTRHVCGHVLNANGDIKHSLEIYYEVLGTVLQGFNDLDLNAPGDGHCGSHRWIG